MSLEWHLVQPPPGTGGEMDAPAHSPAPPQGRRRTPVLSIWSADGREDLMEKSGEEGSILTQLIPRKVSF